MPTVALALDLPIPFSNLGMIIPEVLLPYQEDRHHHHQIESEEFASMNGFEGRVTFDFLTALRINAKQLQVYLDTYAGHSGDFPPADYQALQEKLNRAERLHSATRDSNRELDVGQQGLTEVASAYVEYMREVKRMCHGIWAKFDDEPIYKGMFLLLLNLLMTPLCLLNVHHSIRSLRRAAPYGIGIGTVMGLATGQIHLEVSLVGLLSLLEALLFSSLVIFALFFVWNMRQNIYVKLKVTWQQGVVFFLRNVSLLQVVSLTVTVLYSVSLLSNSFILYEGDMVAFFLQSMVVCFALKKLQLRYKRYSSVEILMDLVPFALLMLCIRLTKLFHSCRDLQVGCEASTFTLSLVSASEYLGSLTGPRCLISCLAVFSVPFSLALLLRHNKHARFLSRWLLWASKYGLPVASLCVAGFWAMQACLTQLQLQTLPHWQHVLLPRIVYITCCTTVAICILRPYQRHTKMFIHDDESNAQTKEIGDDKPNDLDTQDVKLRKLASYDSEAPEDSKDIGLVPMAADTELGATSAFAIVIIVLLVAVWLPIAMLLNDTIALAAVVMVVQVTSFVTALRGWKEGRNMKNVISDCSQGATHKVYTNSANIAICI